jgi:two-component system chemotaxis sensor kinase CheA
MFLQQVSALSEGVIAGWKARVDVLATKLMVEGGGPNISEELRSIRHDANEQQAGACIAVLDALILMMDSDFEAGAAYLLKSGLDDLHVSFMSQSPTTMASKAPVSLSEDAELVADFLVEAREHLSKIEGQMLELERDPSAMEVIHAVFRAFHTIKGLAGFLDFGMVQSLAHEVETLLDLARNEKIRVDSSVVDIVLESGDKLQTELAAIERSLQSGIPLEEADMRALILKIRSRALPQVSSSEPHTGAPLTAENAELALQQPALSANMNVQTESESVRVPEPPHQETATAECLPQPVAPLSVDRPLPLPFVAPLPGVPGLRVQDPGREPEKRSSESGSVRVDTAKLDHLMDMVGEIVIAQSLIRHNQALAATADSRLMGDLSQLARVTAEVQRATMSMRMIPVGQLFQRIERAIRDLSRKTGKQVVLETSGTETGIDKTVAEELSDPLLHMVRNSVDHGIESPSERIAAGKSPEARIRLSARHQGGQVIIQVSDDGRGLNSEKIRAKAEERQLISSTAQLTDNEIYQLIFEPGFSTADQITDVSGRGVGMDVVRRNVEKLRGRIETHSTWGEGTTFLLKLPLTLAIIDGLVVEVGTDRYIIPLSAVWEIFRPQTETLFTIEGRVEMVLVRGQLMPVVRLHQRLGIVGRSSDPSDGLMVVVESNNKRFCLLVDDLLGKQEIVIKSLGETFKDVSALSGCAVLGDGRVGLILDIDGIYRGRQL